MVDMGMRKDHRVQGTHVKFEILVSRIRIGAMPLEHTAFQQEAVAVDLQ